ncbi:MAG: hypothetical protein SFZ03_00525 [Candidatus Melainabacteria bacterium]|nr:hypothetical protein [Candidatus Melainabacteria bacterium]
MQTFLSPSPFLPKKIQPPAHHTKIIQAHFGTQAPDINKPVNEKQFESERILNEVQSGRRDPLAFYGDNLPRPVSGILVLKAVYNSILQEEANQAAKQMASESRTADKSASLASRRNGMQQGIYRTVQQFFSNRRPNFESVEPELLPTEPAREDFSKIKASFLDVYQQFAPEGWPVFSNQRQPTLDAVATALGILNQRGFIHVDPTFYGYAVVSPNFKARSIVLTHQGWEALQANPDVLEQPSELSSLNSLA